MKANLLPLLFIFNLNCCSNKKYYNYTLFRGVPVDENHLEFFKNLSNYYEVNYWTFPSKMYKPVEFTIGPDEKPSFLLEAKKRGVYLTTIIKNVQKAFDKQTVKNYTRRNMNTYNWENYFRLNDIYQWLMDLKAAYPKELELKVIGKTYEDRDIMLVRIAHSGSKLRSKVVVEGGIHAREWISPAFVTYFIYQILTARDSSDGALTAVAFTYEWFFVPVLNPDGYEHTHTQDRLWRKNRAEGGYGIDLNRNFDIDFGNTGSSFDQSSEVYCGEKAFSENETIAISTFLRTIGNDIEYYLAFHSYGQYMMLPYSYTHKHYNNYDEVKKMCEAAASSIATKYKTMYSCGNAYETVGYFASGVSACWVKKEFNVPYVLIFELRDEGRDGFALSPYKIMPTCNETMDGVLSLLMPRTKKYERMRFNDTIHNRQKSTLLDLSVVMCNVLLCIIVIFE